MKKLLLILSLCLLAVCMAFSVVACNDSDEEQTPPPASASMTVSPQNMELVIGDTKDVLVDYDFVQGAKLTFASADTAVATVDELGKVQGVNKGSTTISVKYGELSESVSVTVIDGGLLPSLEFVDGLSGNVQFDVDDTLNLKANVMFNGKAYTDYQPSYEISDKTVAKIENDRLIPLKTGRTEVTVVATWRNFTNLELTKTLSVTVIKNHVVIINDNVPRLTVYTSSPEGQITSQDLQVKIDGVISNDAVLSVQEGSEFIELTGSTITAIKGNGNAVIKATYTVDGIEFSDTIQIEILRPVINYQTVIELFSCDDGDSMSSKKLSEIIQEQFNGEQITDAMQNGETLEMDGYLIKGVTPSIIKDKDGYSIGVENVEVAVYTQTRGIVFTLKAYSKVIDEADDLKMFQTYMASIAAGGTSKDGETLTRVRYYIDYSLPYDGYYILANDINASEYTHGDHLVPSELLTQGERANNPGSNGHSGQTAYIHDKVNNKDVAYNVNTHAGLIGTFDGNGYAIGNIKFTEFGLFGLIGKTGTLKNLAITGATIPSGSNGTVLAGRIFDGAKLENLYVQTSKLNQGTRSSALLSSSMCAGASIKNCVFVVDNSTVQAGTGYGILFHTIWDSVKDNNSTWTNNIVLASIPLSYNGGMKIDAGNKSGQTYTYTGFKRYSNSSEAILDKDNNTEILASFDSAIWDTSSGVPVWKDLPEFEVIKPDLSKIDVEKTFYTPSVATSFISSVYGNGKLELNNDMNYVKQGTSSWKWTFGTGNYSAIRFLIGSDVDFVHIDDIFADSSIKSFSFDVYNPNASDKVYKIGHSVMLNWNGVVRVTGTLKAGEWTTITITRADYEAIASDMAGLAANKTDFVLTINEKLNGWSFYLDNFVISK